MVREPRIMSPQACAEYSASYLVYRVSLNCLASMALEEGNSRYILRPKVHQLGHLVHHYSPFNGRYMSNYLDEDFVGWTKGVAERTDPLHMPMHVCMRYSIALCLKWRREQTSS